MESTPRVALVTGGARRVGRGIVERLAAAGFDVVFTYWQSEQEATDLTQAIGVKGRRVQAIRVDLTQPEAASDELGRFIDEQFGRLDALINNASIYQPGSLQSATVAQMRQMFAIHAEAPLLLCRRFEKQLRQHQGHVVNMVDLLVQKPYAQYLAYCASKAALANLTLGLARELAPEVTVNGIAPGVVEWPVGYPEAQKQQYLQRVPLGRSGTPRDVAELVYFLCTAGSYITGQIIPLDGGRSIT
ncbi:MAG TPA: SDR family oxidoreductase [Tepidisphaeraceae bacterium]|nr:SDR family oxidoreductase [Tepidisphaeraceae bacterium]